MIRRFGEPVDPTRSYKVRPGAYAVLWNGSEVLLTVQDGVREPVPEVQLPGGGIDPGEAVLTALHREVLEETGWTMSNPIRFACYRRYTYMPDYHLWAEKLCHIYLARPCLRRGPPIEPEHSVLWTTPAKALLILSNSGDRFYLRHALGA